MTDFSGAFRRLSPWTLALLPALLLSVWHRHYFIGLYAFDDASYQATADDPERGTFRLVTRAALILFYSAATALSPSRSWAVLGLGALKTYLLIAAITALLRRDLGIPLAFAVACLAAMSSPWQKEYTFVLPDSWMTALSLCCLAWVHGSARPRLGVAGAFFALAVYVKELAAATLLAMLMAARGMFRSSWRFALGAVLVVAVLTATVTVLQRRAWNPFGLVPSAFTGPASPPRPPLVTNARQLTFFLFDETAAGPALTVFYAAGVAGALVARRWTSAGGRALVVWTVVIWITYTGAVVATGFIDPRYAIGPRVALTAAGIAGWLMLIARARLSPVPVRALQGALLVILIGLVAVPGFRVHRDTYARLLVEQDLERRVADLLDRLPVSTPVLLFVDAADPEDTMGGAWWPQRVAIRLTTLSETTPPRRLRRVEQPLTPPLRGEVYITNVDPGPPPPDAVQVIFVSPATETRRLVTTRRLQKDRLKRYAGVRKLYVVLPRALAPALSSEEVTGPIRTMWR